MNWRALTARPGEGRAGRAACEDHLLQILGRETDPLRPVGRIASGSPLLAGASRVFGAGSAERPSERDQQRGVASAGRDGPRRRGDDRFVAGGPGGVWHSDQRPPADGLAAGLRVLDRESLPVDRPGRPRARIDSGGGGFVANRRLVYQYFPAAPDSGNGRGPRRGAEFGQGATAEAAASGRRLRSAALSQSGQGGSRATGEAAAPRGAVQLPGASTPLYPSPLCSFPPGKPSPCTGWAAAAAVCRTSCSAAGAATCSKSRE